MTRFGDMKIDRRAQRHGAIEQSRADGVGKICLGHAILGSDQSESHRHSRLPIEQSAHPMSAFAATTSVPDVELSVCVEIGIHICIGIERRSRRYFLGSLRLRELRWRNGSDLTSRHRGRLSERMRHRSGFPHGSGAAPRASQSNATDSFLSGPRRHRRNARAISYASTAGGSPQRASRYDQNIISE